MTVVFALTAAVVFGKRAYLVLDRELVRVVLGLVLVSQAAVLTLIASSLRRGDAPIYPLRPGRVSDPLSQAMSLTAIVIGLAVTALVLALVVRVVHAFGSDELDEVAEEEAERDARTEIAERRAHEVEEEAAR